jgi:mono/diheme cytochrome c family protein
LLVYQHRVISQTQPSFASPDPRVEFYKTEIAPLIAARCAECHNPERAGRGKSGRLDLTTIAGLLTGGKHKPAIIIGKSTESLLVKRVSSLDPQKIMPPEGEPLTAAQIEALKKWIDDGLAGMSK